MIKSKIYYTIALCNALHYHLTVRHLPDDIVKPEKTYLDLGKKDRWQR